MKNSHLKPAQELLAVWLFLAMPALTFAAGLDVSFGNGGKVTTTFGTLNFCGASDVAVQADGKIVVVGFDSLLNSVDIVLARYHTDGSLDTSFGNGGKVSTSVRQFNYFNGIAIQADGRIVVAGGAGVFGPTSDFAVVRYDTNGSLDATFDGDGKVIIDMGNHNFANDLAVQPDGKILVVGATGVAGSRNFDFAVARLNSDGSLDATFDGDGRVVTSLEAFSDFGPRATALQQDGKIVVVGASGKGNMADYALVRYNADGSLDTSFDGDGKVITVVGRGTSVFVYATDVAVQPDGKIVAVGNAPFGLGVIRYNGNGSLDTSFDGDGIAHPLHDYISSVAIQSNGKLVIAGSNGRDQVIHRYNPNGLPDTSFGSFGSVTTSFDPSRGIEFTAYGSITGLAIQPDGKIVGAGSWGSDGEFAFFTVTRYLGDPTPPIQNVPFFVRQHYLDFLSREPESQGLAFWTKEITSCGSNIQCVEVKRINVSAAFFMSIEFQETGYLSYRIYKTAFGNLSGTPVPLKFNEFLVDTQQIGNGVRVGLGNWQEQLEANKQAYALAFVQRPQFLAAYPNALTPSEVVAQMDTNAGTVLSTTEKNELIALLGSTPTDVSKRAAVLRAVAENSQLRTAEFNRAFVLMQYFGYLRRNPNDAPEPTRDFQGYNFWLNKLNQFGGNFVDAEMVKAFITSTEYRQRFGQ